MPTKRKIVRDILIADVACTLAVVFAVAVLALLTYWTSGWVWAFILVAYGIIHWIDSADHRASIAIHQAKVDAERRKRRGQ